MAREPDTQLARRDVVRDILAGRGGALVIGGLGSPAWDCAAVENNPLDFLLWGAMGNAASIGLGLAQGAQGLDGTVKHALFFAGQSID